MNRTSRRGLPVSAGVSVPSDRRFRRADVSAARRSRARRTIFRVMRWLIPAVVMGAGALWMAGLLLQSEVLRVQRLVVRGNSRLSAPDVEALVPSLRGENILSVDFEAYRRRLLDSPWIADVSLWRMLPATIELRIVERVPMAVARLDRQLYLVDDTGVIIDEFGPSYRDLDLPIVDGLMVPARGAAAPVPAERARLAHGLLAAVQERPDLQARLSQIDVSNPLDAKVLIDDDPAWLHLGETRFVERMQNYLDLRPTLRGRFSEIEYVDLRFDERVYLHGKAGAVTPASAPRTMRME